MLSTEIYTLMEEFISGADISLKLANRLEVLIDDAFPEDDFMQETVEILACYRPEGGEAAVGPEIVRRRLVEAREYLSRH